MFIISILIFGILSIFLGLLFGFALSYLLTANAVAKSNDHGDSKGNFQDFAEYPLHVLSSQDNIRPPR